MYEYVSGCHRFIDFIVSLLFLCVVCVPVHKQFSFTHLPPSFSLFSLHLVLSRAHANTILRLLNVLPIYKYEKYLREYI